MVTFNVENRLKFILNERIDKNMDAILLGQIDFRCENFYLRQYNKYHVCKNEGYKNYEVTKWN